MSVVLRAGATRSPATTAMLGVLGGMGPLATAWFYRRVVEATPSMRDQDHVPIVIWGDPTVPDRSSALLRSDAPSPLPWLLRGARALVAMGAELIAVPCNTAHPFLDELQMAVEVPVIDMVKATVENAIEHVGPGGKVAVFCTEGAYQAEIYQRRLRAAGVYPVEMAASDRRRTHRVIEDIKAGRLDVARRGLLEVVPGLAAARPDLVLLGCTELTAVRDEIESTFPVMDSATVLAINAVAAWRGHRRQAR